MADIDSLLHILIVVHFAIKEAGIIIPKITEQDQYRQLEILRNSILFSKGMSQNLVASSINQYVLSHKEPVLLSYILGAMDEAGFFKNENDSSKYLIMAGINLASCIAET